MLRAYALISALFDKKETIQKTHDLRLVRVLERTQALQNVPDAYLLAHALPLLLNYAPSITTKTTAPALLKKLLADADVMRYLQVNVHDGVTWFKHEPFEVLSTALLSAAQQGKSSKLSELAKGLKAAEKRSKYQLDGLLPKAAKKAATKKPTAKKASAKAGSSKKASTKKSASKANATKSKSSKAADAKVSKKAATKAKAAKADKVSTKAKPKSKSSAKP